MNDVTRLIVSFSFLLISSAWSFADPTEEYWQEDASIKYLGVCDGSAAVRINDTTLLVANDETNVLHSFDIWGGPPVASLDIGNLLEIDPRKPEIDFEAVASDGDRLWWIGSHGRNKNGKSRPNRRMLFATSVPRRDLSDIRLMSVQYDLVPVLQSHSELSEILTEEVIKTAPKEGGLNIEGLAFAPDGTLMLGLRAPLTGTQGMLGDALIVRLSYEDESWSVSSFQQLPLANMGVRDMVWTDDTLTIIAGPVASGGTSVLYTWSGTDVVQPVEAPSFKGFNAEALVRIDSKWLVMSDDGSEMRSAANGKIEECKELADSGGIIGVYSRARILSQR